MRGLFSVREILEQYVPSLFKLMEGQNISWSSINKQFEDDFISKVKRIGGIHGTIIVDMNFYNVVYGVIKKLDDGVRLMGYFDYVFNNLNKNLTPQEKILIGKTIRNLLTDFTRDYIHYMGELSVINYFTKSGYRLREVEHSIETGKKIDFHVVSEKDDKHFLLEVMNVRLPENMPSDYNYIDKFLRGRINSKIKGKTNNDKKKFIFHIIPVLWGDVNDIRKVGDFYINGPGIKMDKIIEPFCLSIFVNQIDKEVLYKFEKVSTCIDP